MAEPSAESMKRAKKMAAWAGNGLPVFLHKLACEFDAVRAQAFEEAARLCDDASNDARKRCNTFVHGTPECGQQSVLAHGAYMLAEKIRMRAREAPSG